MSIENTNLSEFTPRVKKLINEIIDAVNTTVGDLRDYVTSTALATALSAYVSLTGTQTLTNKTLTSPTINGGTSTALEKVTAVSAAGAITIAQGIVAVTATSAAALTLAAPSSVNGTIIRIVSTTAFAHTVTFTGGTLADGTATAKTTATFAAYAGAHIAVMAYGSKWYLIDSVAATLA